MKTAVAYYPEHWPRERWETDARLMREAGVSAARLGEFAWSSLEPAEGRFETHWLLEAIELLAKYEIRVVLCSPTPAYPPWLHRKYPDVHIVRPDGRIVEYGQRQDACKNHPGYRDCAVEVTERVAAELGSHPNVVAWQIDNELGCHDTARCYCVRCETRFQDWLRVRFHDDVRELNDAWGTAFWSHRYATFDEISLPRDTADMRDGGGQNPGLVLDFYRFSSDVQVRFQRDLILAVRSHSDRPVTHNLMGGYSKINYFDLARDLDFVSWDNYPFMRLPDVPRRNSAFANQLMRGLKKQNTWVMEQAAGPGGWTHLHPEVEPGRMRLWALQAVAHGAEQITFFRWRTTRFGTEQFWHGILHHHGEPGRRFDELASLSQEIERLRGVVGRLEPYGRVAVMFDFDSLWSFEIQPMVSNGLDYRRFAEDIVDQLAALGLTASVVAPGEPLDEFSLVVVPSFRVGAADHAAQLEAYVRRGGLLVLGPRSGARDRENAIVGEVLPASLRSLVGARILEYDVFSGVPGLDMSVGDEKGAVYRAHGLAEILEPDDDAVVRLRYRARYYAGEPAAVSHVVDSGSCHYLATVLAGVDLRSYLVPIVEAAGITIITDLPETVEIVRCSSDRGLVTLYLNHGSDPHQIVVQEDSVDLLTGETLGRGAAIELDGLAVRAVQTAP